MQDTIRAKKDHAPAWSFIVLLRFFLRRRTPLLLRIVRLRRASLRVRNAFRHRPVPPSAYMHGPERIEVRTARLLISAHSPV